MSAISHGGDARGFYAALGVQLPAWAQVEAPVRCFADPQAHAHEDRDASCSVNLESGAFNCHACGAHGGAYDAALALGRSPREAMDLLVAHGLAERRLGSRAAARPTPAPTPKPKRAQPQPAFAIQPEQVGEWVRALAGNDGLLGRLEAERGWAAHVLRRLDVGFDGERITVPIPGEHDGVQGLLRLRVDPSQQPKVLAAQGTRLGLIPRPAAEPYVWLVEGPSDMLAARSAGVPALAVPGTHAWRTEWASGFTGRCVAVVMDADRPGRRAALRIASDLEQHDVARVRILELAADRADGYDLSDWLREAGHPTIRSYTSEQFGQLFDSSRRSGPIGAVAGGHAQRSHGCLRY